MTTYPIETITAAAPVVPVVIIKETRQAVPLAQALLRGGVKIIEITLRTPVALDCISAIKKEVPDIIIGAGTIMNPSQLEAALEAGAHFGVSPGSTATLRDAVKANGMPFLFGAITPSEVMTLLDDGFQYVKFFPAEASGGIKTLASWQSPLANAKFCPTGGIDVIKAKEYLNLGNVVCVGGSWVAPMHALENDDWPIIEQHAAQVMALAEDI
ncbi:bifunctional 4-hydroxy-2-oxoglutarate aldolase/2-dehydro-3-deoxy-phosphogluconate aldolase [Acanthopleuribacter pedis]|uniref:2-dehydro-3-deoxy-phosphogluconate aldolase n=1 Tax=Acanthopleuribacter pedis TaxID=442870 RepID=A0A8J7U1H1_9BACT|nr:bifunctional 4-hydroxy-2-oxoglutarate aldolase/2-dehydro-3-deoxy-phosphogluconate aldolase [Acanthopleuribacter pedis]MBO1317522.1 bifunctional 4-hydroxy-2-oxoglutarate aldolase/2-dehydro-3-deoxy-phosphogluconate aldolase [Acanthopleuribacter pedis]